MFVDSTSWSRLVPLLTGYRVHLVDAPSCGASDSLRASADISACADAAAELVVELQKRYGYGPVGWVVDASPGVVISGWNLLPVDRI
ncbi:MAG: hypothetical protein WBQ44_22690 [Rhodococcus sp. (in: high G+C Gram-positive bacteria)]